jgi:single-strand DNA-binding protein
MLGINQVVIVGTVAADPDVQKFNEHKRANLFLAVNEKERRVNKETGEQEWTDVTRWVTIEFWGGQAGFIEKYVTKGANIAVVGKFSRTSWEAEGGKKNKTVVEGSNISLLTSTKPSRKENAKNVLAYLEQLQTQGKSISDGIAALKTVTEAVQELEDMPF